MQLRIAGRNLPGRQFSSAERTYPNVHVGVQVRRDPVGLFRADSSGASWDVDVTVVHTAEGTVDFRGPAVHGTRGDRFLYLTWGDVRTDGSFEMFRRAKLMLNRVDPDLVEAAERTGVALVATVEMTGSGGGPRCARVDSPAIEWSLS